MSEITQKKDPSTQKPLKSLMDFFFQSANGRMQDFVRTFNRVARTEMPVLIVGEPGTGKEMVAQAMHQRSLRSDEPLVKIDCQLSPKQVLDAQLDQLQNSSLGSELTHANGSTLAGIDGHRPGSVYFHEIAELTLEQQAKVLALLPDGSADGSGDLAGGGLRPRILASTSRDLRQEMTQGKFRPDLYFTLGGVMLEIPALRTRRDDLPALADHFLRKYSREFGRLERPHLSPEALDILCHYDWPGNLPELSSLMRRIVFIGSVDAALAELTRVPAPGPGSEDHREPARDKTGLKAMAKEAAQRVEREMIMQVLRERQWNRRRAASALNISYKTLLSKIKQLGLTDEV